MLVVEGNIESGTPVLGRTLASQTDGTNRQKMDRDQVSYPAGGNRDVGLMVSGKQLPLWECSPLLFVVACGGDATATPGSIFPTAAPIPTATAAPTPTIPPTPSSPLLRLNLGGEPNTLDPQLASSLLEFSVLRQLSEGLSL